MGTGNMFTGTGWDRALRDRDGSGTAACGKRRERNWKTSPVQHSSSYSLVTLCAVLLMVTITVQWLWWSTSRTSLEMIPSKTQSRTWLRAIQSQQRPINVGPSYMWRKQPLENTGVWLRTRLLSRRACHEEREMPRSSVNVL